MPSITRKRGFAQGVTVLHFRKLVYMQKIGSQENRHPVIYWYAYHSANYKYKKISRQGKSLTLPSGA